MITKIQYTLHRAPGPNHHTAIRHPTTPQHTIHQYTLPTRQQGGKTSGTRYIHLGTYTWSQYLPKNQGVQDNIPKSITKEQEAQDNTYQYINMIFTK